MFADLPRGERKNNGGGWWETMRAMPFVKESSKRQRLAGELELVGFSCEKPILMSFSAWGFLSNWTGNNDKPF